MLLEDDDIRGAVAARLKVAVSDLPDYWAGVVAQAHVSGWADVTEGLLRRGFTLAQVESWDRAEEFERSQSVYYALLNGGALEAFDMGGLRLLDRRRELESIQVYSQGRYVVPLEGAAGPGTVGAGDRQGGAPPEQFPASGFNW